MLKLLLYFNFAEKSAKPYLQTKEITQLINYPEVAEIYDINLEDLKKKKISSLVMVGWTPKRPY